MSDHVLSLPGDRRLRYREVGDPEGPVVIYHHGTPSCGVLPSLWQHDAQLRRIRLVGVDRSGYGGSTAQSGRGLREAADDTMRVADDLGADTFLTWGISGGGPHALACAALFPHRVVAVASLAGVAPWDAPGLDYLEGMGQDNREEFAAAETGGAVLREHLDGLRAAILRGDEDDEVLDSLLCDADREFLQTPAGAEVTASMAEGLATSAAGWFDDDRAFVAPWPFRVEQVTRPTMVMHGERDGFVPVSHGRWLAERIPGVTARFLPEEGHLSLYGLVPQMHEWLLGQR